ncbi:hypothetical protein [Cellulomonas soli]|uniref:Uncharacterized protein n=1 Tax=Cellulomonas soli TaxID=931535 RepID=A0A512PG19_9CELL|nr:hypothetical protein [Cellulomonas soli]NYI59721.1 hypothetical protein [Cellulomonas soli]GEP70136.1 hypothetical protein CSO01_28510 [Cellulomonas soli]
MTVVGGDVDGTSVQVRSGAGVAPAPRRARRVRRAGVVLALLAGAGALSACSGQPGTAAIVEGRTITPGEVQQVLDELGPYLQSASTSAVLTILVQEPAVSAVAAEHGVAVSDEDAADALTQVAAADGLKGSDFSAASLTVAKFSVEYGKLTALEDADAINAELVERVAALDVEVNPRFGTLGDGNFVSDPSVRPWIFQSGDATGSDATGTDGSSGSTPTPSATESPVEK